MSNFTGNAIIAKTKALYGHRLKTEDYEELLKFGTVSEIVSYLKKQNKYSNTLTDVIEYSTHRGQLEELIKKSYFKNIAKIVKFVGTSDKKFYELDMIRREIDIVLASLRSIISGSIEGSIRDLPLFFKQHASFDIGDLSSSLTMKDFLKAIQNTRYYDVIKPYYTDDPNFIKYANIEQDLLLQYHDIVISRINQYYKGKTRRTLMDIYQSKVEIENIIKIYRLKKFYKTSNEEIKASLLTHNIRMSKNKLNELIDLDDPEEILKALSKSQFAEFKDKDDYVYIEYQAGKIKYNLAKRYMYFSNNPPVVYTVFLFLNDIERSNIFNIIEGVRYDIDQEDIKKMLIY
ncbi:MAG: V-type ATPase subunit [Tenericutes bacterium]|nr:V-type ATPase subunit [Mycoplasmatota bacterium]